MMRRLNILDTTLRDGEQTPGVAFTQNEKVEIAIMLDALGVDIIEVGVAAMGKDEIEAIKSIQQLKLKADLLIWNRMKMEDIDFALQTGVKNVHIAVPSSDIHLKQKLFTTRMQVLDEMTLVIKYAKSKGLNVSIGAEDASRADLDFLKTLYYEAVEAGAERVRYADTLGILSPFMTLEIIKTLTTELTVPLDFHGHNDLGMGTANALAAYKAGADWISCSINGLGERAGNTALEEIVAALTYIEDTESRINKKLLMQASEMVALYSGKKVHDLKPIVGQNCFSHESGIHVDGILKDASVYEALMPEEFGRKREIVLGKLSGRHAVIYKMKALGYDVDFQKAGKIIELIRSYSYQNKMDDEILTQILRNNMEY